MKKDWVVRVFDANGKCIPIKVIDESFSDDHVYHNEVILGSVSRFAAKKQAKVLAGNTPGAEDYTLKSREVDSEN